MSEVTLADFEIRYVNIWKEYPTMKTCSVDECGNPRDTTEGMGVDTTCAYHRLLFDYWIMEVVSPDYTHRYIMNEKLRRMEFSTWMALEGKLKCNRIVLHLAQEPINWVC